MPLYTEKQLSMILSAHAAGMLVVRGLYNFGLDDFSVGGCINQVAFNDPVPGAAAAKNADAAWWFDTCYLPSMPVEDLLRKLESF